MNDSREDETNSSERGPLAFEEVLAQLFDAVAVAQAQNDVLLGLLSSLVSSAEELEDEQVLADARESFLQHYERRIEHMKNQYPFFDGGEGSSGDNES